MNAVTTSTSRVKRCARLARVGSVPIAEIDPIYLVMEVDFGLTSMFANVEKYIALNVCGPVLIV
jgi:hypothetical protein